MNDRRAMESLVQGYLDGSLTADESRRLRAELRRQPAQVRVILDGLRTDCLIRAVLAESDDLLAEDGNRPTLSEPLIEPGPDRGARHSAPSWPSRRHLWWGSLALAASIVLLLGIGYQLLGPTVGKPMLAIVDGGDVTIQRGPQFLSPVNGLQLQASDVLTAGPSSRALVSFGAEPTRLELGPGSQLKLISLHRGKRLRLAYGSLAATVSKQRLLQPMIVDTPHAVARVLGTEFTLVSNTNETRLEVTAGRVRLAALKGGDSIVIAPGGSATVSNGQRKISRQALIGKVRRDYWLGLAGDTLYDLKDAPTFPEHPTGHDFPTSFEVNTNWAAAYGTRMRAYILPPKTGDYSFRISGNGQVRFWISPDEDPANKVIVGQIIFTKDQATDPGGPNPSSQRSGPIRLTSGQRYYIETVHKFGSGEERLSLIWTAPGRNQEPIPPDNLAPYLNSDANGRR